MWQGFCLCVNHQVILVYFFSTYISLSKIFSEPHKSLNSQIAKPLTRIQKGKKKTTKNQDTFIQFFKFQAWCSLLRIKRGMRSGTYGASHILIAIVVMQAKLTTHSSKYLQRSRLSGNRKNFSLKL